MEAKQPTADVSMPLVVGAYSSYPLPRLDELRRSEEELLREAGVLFRSVERPADTVARDDARLVTVLF